MGSALASNSGQKIWGIQVSYGNEYEKSCSVSSKSKFHGTSPSASFRMYGSTALDTDAPGKTNKGGWLRSGSLTKAFTKQYVSVEQGSNLLGILDCAWSRRTVGNPGRVGNRSGHTGKSR